ncbi:MAG: kynureninase [Gemmataceae bacterium]
MATPADRDYALHLDAADPLAEFRDRFHIPPDAAGKSLAYLCGHSLGLQPKAARDLVIEELDAWARLGVEGHFKGDAPWYTYHELLREPGARLVGARPDEVVFMKGLTVNLHLLMATFYRPTRERDAILIDEPTFPSDRYAILAQVRHHGRDESALLPCPAEEDRIEEVLEREGDRIAVVWLAGVNFLSGRRLDLERLTKAAHGRGCLVGLDLAHAAGNVPLSLHDWDVDFAVWCSYKYLNGGPGAVAGAFVHERHGQDLNLPRLAGWWGNDPTTRFRMQLERDFVPRAGADGWQVSNPPILALAPLRASLGLFDEATMPALWAKSERLTGYLIDLLSLLPSSRCEVLTPRDPARRGCQVSLRIPDRPREVQKALQAAGVVCDFREPDVIRAAPVPLYNTFSEVWTFARTLAGDAWPSR